MTNFKEGSRDAGNGIVISLAPDVCLTRRGKHIIPIPYSISAKQEDDANTTATVNMTGQRCHNMGSIITKCKGDEAGKYGGIKSGTYKSVCHPKTHSKSVNIQGKPAVMNSDIWYMNNKNTIGKLYYIKDTSHFDRTMAINLYEDDTIK